MFESSYEALLLRHLGRRPLPSDGYPDDTIRQAESRLGFPLPQSLREYYRCAGANDSLNRSHNLLFPPSQLEIVEQYLLFMEENQAVVHWGMALACIDEPDPMVHQRVNCDPPEWYSEELTFSVFIVRMLDWQAGLDPGQ